MGVRDRSFVRRLGALLGTRRPATVYECRRCGQTLEADTDACPECGHDNVAAYRVD